MPSTSDPIALEAISTAALQMREAERHHYDKIAQYLPVGTRVAYKSGDNLIEAVVLRTDEDRVCLHNPWTGCPYHIHADLLTDILHEWEVK